MNVVQAGKLMGMMLEAWPNAHVKPENVKHYAEALADLDFEGLVLAAEQLRATEEFLPSIARLRRKYYDLLGMGNPERAWEQLVSVVKEPSIDIHWQEREGLDPIGIAALMSLGGMPELRFSERPEFLRGEFIRAYERRYLDELASPKVSQELVQLGPVKVVQMLSDGKTPELGGGVE